MQLLTEAEGHQVSVKWNNIQAKYLQHKCIHQLFEEQVEQTPDAVAVVFENQQLTYRELNERANQLARHLQALGVGPEVRVGICIERSSEMVVGLLGTLKAGGVYVPLDPRLPQERLAFMLLDSQVSVLLSQQMLLNKLPEHQASLVCLEQDWEVISQKSEENLVSSVKAENLAYVIYTSGSTGRPKGVLISHSSLANHCCTIQQKYKLDFNDRVLQFASINFDASLEQIFPTLIVGATLVLRDSDVWTARSFCQKILDFGLTVVNFPTAYWQQLVKQLVENPELNVKNQLRLVIVGGDSILPESLSLWKQSSFSSVYLLNAYGPTEATITATLFEIPAQFGEGTNPQRVPIGRPLANKTIYILNHHLQPVPVGVEGELYIGGASIALGYLNRPDLTAERFIPDRFSNKPGARLYKTGDLACYLPDGNIEFLGRIDHQVKVRGFRIELGEIESALTSHPKVWETVVVTQEDQLGNKCLVAYVVPKQKVGVTSSELRSFLQKKLPDYMIPSVFVTLNALPLTPSGKVDRLGLPQPDQIHHEREETFVAPRTSFEEELTRIWAEVLRLEQVGINDNFLELGGHSLLAVETLSRVQRIYNVELPLHCLLEAPTVAELAKHLETACQNQKQEFLPQAIQAVKRNRNLPASFGQQQMWLLNQLNADIPVYNETATVRLTGPINVEALSRSLNEIIRRHEVLRTTFRQINGEVVQVIAPAITVSLPFVELQQIPESEREMEALRLATLDAQQPFDLASGPLLRAILIQLSVTDYRLYLTLHHIVTDGVSLYNVFLKELEALYTAFDAGQASPLADLPIQYADFAIWQQQCLLSEVLEADLTYWKQQLTNLPVLQLPTKGLRPSVQIFRGARQCLALSSRLTEAIKALSRQEKVTPFMTLLAAFKTLLYRYTQQEDIVVGTVTAGRERPELQGLIGFFLNNLVLRTDVSSNPSFAELLQRVREVTLGAYAHQNLPFEHLVQALNPKRSLSHNPLFQVSFVLEPPVPVIDSGWTISQLDVDTAIAKFDLTVELDERPEGIIGRFEYNTDLFDDVTINRMIGHFQTLLESIASNPNQHLEEIPLLTETEQHQLLEEWNNTHTDYPQNKCIHQLFEEQVERTPDAVAVVFEDQQLTYQELNIRANQLAHHLQTMGVRPEVLVGICVDSSLEMVVGLLAILKAGGAYLPLDPRLPQERLAYMLSDSQVKVLLTQKQIIGELPQTTTNVVVLDRDWEAICQYSQFNPVSGVKPFNLAYVIYTSGSTGQPKGVAIPHSAICNHMLWMQANFPLTETDKVLQKTPFSFDASVWEFFAPLLAGAQLVMARPRGHQDSAYLTQVIREQQITTLQLVPSLLQMLLEQEEFKTCKSLKRVFCGGEALSVVLQERFFDQLNADWHNLYGPTEACIDATFWTCKRGINQQVVPIGRPIANTQIYILDNQLQPVPVGVKGELYIGGAGLARCYLNRPDLTAEKFISNPFSQFEGARLYKTGDLARSLPDGNIEYLGRIDHQVKIRGFRIEIGEIEAVLSQHLQVRETIVIAREDRPGDKRLVAYIVPNKKKKLSIGDLRAYLLGKLPDYMIPQAIVILETLPLTPNGKVDRRMLPMPDSSKPELEEKFVAPRTLIEEVMANIWAEVLGLEKVGVNDNFFNLGGHSLKATQVISRVQKAFQVNLPMRKLFEEPTIAQLSQSIEKSNHSDTELQMSAIRPISREKHRISVSRKQL
ncbi:amino acid adenylation domain-containing protein [uncultured Nostoc sp.]|uniref:amino acid adenylation domain-containing protein n=1 Tax=uncultured Nostoc sp. TaxID=340711 RepID=UPI0035CAB8FC